MNNYLNQFAANKYSQNGEDGIIEKIFTIMPYNEENWCVEFGAWDGKFLSNTYELIANRNWKGVLIEGNSKKFPDLVKTFSQIDRVNLINKYIGFEGKETLDNILKGTEIPIDFDLLSIDIDGNDYHIWESMLIYRPKLIIIEFNPSIPSDIEFVQKKNMRVNHGNSLLSLIKLGKSKGYELIATTFCNGFFIKKEYFGLFNIENNSIELLWNIIEAPRIFQLYDGTLVLSKEFNLIWHKKLVSTNDFQVVPGLLRDFGDTGSFKTKLRKIALFFYFKLKVKNKFQKLLLYISK